MKKIDLDGTPATTLAAVRDLLSDVARIAQMLGTRLGGPDAPAQMAANPELARQLLRPDWLYAVASVLEIAARGYQDDPLTTLSA